MNEEHFTFHLQHKHSGAFANSKYEELSYPKNQKMCVPFLVTLLKIRPHYSQSSRENATPPCSTSPLASYKEVTPPPPESRSSLAKVWWKLTEKRKGCPPRPLPNSPLGTLLDRGVLPLSGISPTSLHFTLPLLHPLFLVIIIKSTLAFWRQSTKSVWQPWLSVIKALCVSLLQREAPLCRWEARGIAHHVLSYYYYYYYHYYYYYYYYYYLRFTSVIAMDFLSQHPSPNHGFWEAKGVSTWWRGPAWEGGL